MRFLIALIALVALTFNSSVFADGHERFKDEQGKHFDILTPAGKPIVRYEYARDTSDDNKKFDTAKVFHQVFDEDGKKLITKGAGGQFPHHRGLFIGWNKIKHDGKSYDLWHVRNTEQIHKGFIEKTATKEMSSVTTLVHWRTDDETVLIEEKRTIIVHFHDDDVHALIDFVSELKAVAGDLELNGDPEHAGMQYRPSQEVAQNKSATYVFPEGIKDVKKETDLPWATLTYNIKDKTYSVQHMNHPGNPKGTKYSAYRDYGRFGAFPVINLKKDETTTVKYRIRITPGEAPARDVLNEQYEKYVGDERA